MDLRLVRLTKTVLSRMHAHRHALIAAVWLSLGACARTVDAPATHREATHREATHREALRQILEVHCGLCHLPPAIGGGTGMALPIYDLSAADWSGTLSDAQLPIVEQKLHDDGADVTEMQVANRFVVDELAWRDAHAALYPLALRERAPRATTP